MEREKNKLRNEPQADYRPGAFYIIMMPARQKIKGMFRYFEIITYFCIRN